MTGAGGMYVGETTYRVTMLVFRAPCFFAQSIPSAVSFFTFQNSRVYGTDLPLSTLCFWKQTRQARGLLVQMHFVVSGEEPRPLEIDQVPLACDGQLDARHARGTIR